MFSQTQAIMRKLYYLLVFCLAVMLTAILLWWHLKPSQRTGTPSPAESKPANTPDHKTAALSSAPAANTTVPAGLDATEEQLLAEVGWYISRSARLPELGFDQDQAAAILRGVKLSLEGKDAPLPPESAVFKINSYMQNRIQVARAKAQKEAQTTEAAYFANLKSKGISSTPSGLYYEIIQQGSEKKPGPTDSVTVNYTGRLTDGKVFDSSNTPGKPAVFQLNRLIRGWAEGLQLIGVGGKIKLYVPYSLGYGQAGQPKIPPFSTLEFEVELLGTTPAPVQPVPAHPVPPNPHPVSRGPGNPAPGNPAPGNPAPGNPAPGNPAPVSPAPVSSVY